MTKRILGIVITGLLGGALVGTLIGIYSVTITVDHVIRRDDFATSLAFEQSQSRYMWTVIVAFFATFTAIGPVIAGFSFGKWARHSVGGFLGVFMTLTFLSLTCALVTNQQPFNHRKGAQSTCIDFSRIYAGPISLIIGPALGIAIGMICSAESYVRSNRVEPVS